jgi:[NiFe] hydrogenase large subunit/hydrogenase large subunit
MPRIAIDPITRIEGHLRIEVQVTDGEVRDAWSITPMFRGLELVLQKRDPRDAWVFAQRICGVCTTVNAIASVRAVEDALGITIPDNARILRNLIEGAQDVHDHLVHFYHLHGPDWFDVMSALRANPRATSELQRSISSWPQNSARYFRGVRNRLQSFVDSGQLGLFANAYWGHPAYRLSPESNLLFMAHYLEALDWQREVAKIHAILGGRNPHPQTYLVGGMATPIDPDSDKAINRTSIAELRKLVSKTQLFVKQVYVPDLLHLASEYPEWTGYGEGPGNFMAVGDFPNASGELWLPPGIILKRGSGRVRPLREKRITEDVTRAWYKDAPALHPAKGETRPRYTGARPPFEFQTTDGEYSWSKAPRYDGKVMEVGPLARMLVAYASGHRQVRAKIDKTLAVLGLGQEALQSTLGRILARGLETQLVANKMNKWLRELEKNMKAGDLRVHDSSSWRPGTWPAVAEGYGKTEAPRGALGHWIRIENQKISHYQCVVPSTWNGSPRDAAGQRGPWEQALIGTPVADLDQPLEILRTVHSYDPCMACAVHVIDGSGNEVTRVRVVA